MKILIVEDSVALNETLKNALSKEGFEIISGLDGKQAKEKSYKHRPDIILLDIMLPDVKGYNLIDFFKKNGNPIVIVISALEEEEMRKIAYEKGADDYLIKPITLFELKYKLKAIEKRTVKNEFNYSVGDISFNLQSLELTCQNNTIILQHSQMLLLNMLYDRYKDDKILDKNELIDIEEMRESTSFRIHTLIGRLRKKLIEAGSEKIIIDNEYGKGYKLVVMR